MNSAALGCCLLLAATLGLSACASKPPSAYRTESFEPETPFQFHTDADPDQVCDRGRRALLSQGYEVETLSQRNIRGTKFFLPQADTQLQLRITLVCLPEPTGSGATVYANALQTRYELKAANGSTGLSVAGIGSISLPWPSDSGSLVKVGDETVSDPNFYQRLFVLIENMDS